MRATGYLFVTLASLASVVWAEDLLFPYMHGLKYSEYDIAIKQGLTGRVAKHRTIQDPADQTSSRLQGRGRVGFHDNSRLCQVQGHRDPRLSLQLQPRH